MLKTFAVVVLVTIVVSFMWGVLAGSLGIPTLIATLVGMILGAFTSYATLLYMES